MSSVLNTSSNAYSSLQQRLADARANEADVASARAGTTDNGGDARTGAAVSAAGLGPSQVGDRLHSLIDLQAGIGAITSDQAAILRQTFTSSALAADGAASAGTAAKPAALSPSEVLATFIQGLQGAQSKTVGYASNGSSTEAQPTSTRLLDFNT